MDPSYAPFRFRRRIHIDLRLCHPLENRPHHRKRDYQEPTYLQNLDVPYTLMDDLHCTRRFIYHLSWNGTQILWATFEHRSFNRGGESWKLFRFERQRWWLDSRFFTFKSLFDDKSTSIILAYSEMSTGFTSRKASVPTFQVTSPYYIQLAIVYPACFQVIIISLIYYWFPAFCGLRFEKLDIWDHVRFWLESILGSNIDNQ